MAQKQKPREHSFLRVLVPDWQPTRAQVQGAIRIVVVVAGVLLLVLLVLYLIGRRFDITLLNLLRILAVPITVGAAVPLLNWLQKKRELDLENQRAQDEALRAYLDQMSQLLTDKERPLHSAQPGDDLSTLARARTPTVLLRLDVDRKRSVLQFLYESGLKYKEQTPLSELDLIERRPNIVSLQQADLSGAHLNGISLDYANLSHADPSGADLFGALGITNEKIEQAARRLECATMPNGQRYDDWLKSKDREKDGMKDGSS